MNIDATIYGVSENGPTSRAHPAKLNHFQKLHWPHLMHVTECNVE